VTAHLLCGQRHIPSSQSHQMSLLRNLANQVAT
jgi:hypothetical protein